MFIQILSLLLVCGMAFSEGLCGEDPCLKIDLTGTLPIIISASHGGWMMPSSIPDRQYGCYNAATDTCTYTHSCTGDRIKKECPITTVRDLKTDDVAKRLYTELTSVFGASPKLVISYLNRKKVDLNREINEATLNDPNGVAVYNEYHDALVEAKAGINGRGLLLDIHGHSRDRWTMLGYLIKGTDLDEMSDSELNGKRSSSSIRHLASVSSNSFVDLLRGSGKSLGSIMENEGLAAVPSPNNQSPEGKRFYSGGYITKTHGSRDGGEIDAIQIEIHTKNRTPLANRIDFTEKLAKTLTKYFKMYYPEHVPAKVAP